MTINKVMSNNVKSKIFDAFNNYFIQFSDFNYTITDKPQDNNIDIYHYHRPNIETKLKPNSIVTVHHDLEDTDPWLHMDKFISRYKEASHIVCLNTIQQQILKQKGITNTTVIPHGYKDEIFEKKELRSYNKEKKITLGIVSKRYPRRVKGEAYLLELIKRLDSDKYDFILVGEGRSKDAALLGQYGFDVEVFNMLPYDLYPQVYKKIDFLLMISLFEGGPANLPEALASAVPVITKDIAMAHDMIKDKQNGILLTGDIEEDALKIDMLHTNNGELFNKLQQNLQEKQDILSWKQVVQAYEEVYKKAAGIKI
ncbi:MAG: glycosyltransferase family 4 protein [Campylobacterota bacterium]|nr:glycosyltransferase family 4 protein [Campylobacterota bacterium]